MFAYYSPLDQLKELCDTVGIMCMSNSQRSTKPEEFDKLNDICIRIFQEVTEPGACMLVLIVIVIIGERFLSDNSRIIPTSTQSGSTSTTT